MVSDPRSRVPAVHRLPPACSAGAISRGIADGLRERLSRLITSPAPVNGNDGA